MNDDASGDGWRPLSRPAATATAGLAELGLGPASKGLPPFVRLARTHALHAAGDAIVAVALAGSLFFSIDTSAARSRVLLYLFCTLLPFLLVGPFIGPALDRMRGGRRLMIILTLVLRTGLMLLMIPTIDSLWLFPIAFAQLVLGKTYSVAKAATLPSTVRSDEELVDKNSRLAVLSAVAGFCAAAPALLLQQLLGSTYTLSYALIVYAVGVAAAIQLPRVIVDDPEIEDDDLELRSVGVRLAASAMSVVRGIVGFMFFMLAFSFRGEDLESGGIGFASGMSLREAIGFETVESGDAWKLGVVLAFWGGGILFGNLLAGRLRERLTEEIITIVCLVSIFVAAVASIWAGGLSGAALLALVVGAAPAIAKLAFDSLVQRDAPGANLGAAFARFETRFQMFWVVGAIVPVLLTIPLRLGFLVVALAAAFAGVTYFLGFRTAGDDVVPQRRPRAATDQADGESRSPQRPRPRRQTPAAPVEPPDREFDRPSPRVAATEPHDEYAGYDEYEEHEPPARPAPRRLRMPRQRRGQRRAPIEIEPDAGADQYQTDQVSADHYDDEFDDDSYEGDSYDDGYRPAVNADPYAEAFAEQTFEPPRWDADPWNEDLDLPNWIQE